MSMVKRAEKNKEEDIWNIPNIITSIRIITTFIILYFIFAHFSIIYIVVAFAIGALTDFFDGQIARRFNMETEFGRKFDIVADRFMMISVVIGILIASFADNLLSYTQILQIFLILSREIITFPFALIAFIAKKHLVHARFIGKLTTFLQGFALPSILLSSEHSFFSYAPYLSIITSLSGIISAITYIKDIKEDKR